MKEFDLVIVGNGISSFSFLNKLIKNPKYNKNKKICIISYNNQKSININKVHKKYAKDNLIVGSNNSVVQSFQNYLHKNNLSIEKDLSIFGSLESGGVSNRWGMNLQLCNKKDLFFLNEKNKSLIFKNFEEIYNDYGFSGHFLDNVDFKTYNQTVDQIFKDILKDKISSEISFNSSANAISKRENLKNFTICNSKNNSCWTNCLSNSTFVPKNIFKEILNKLKIEYMNLFVEEINKEENFFRLKCNFNDNIEYIKTKKLVLASGTISTTRLILKFLKYKSPINLRHNPMLFSLYLAKKKVIQNLRYWQSQVSFRTVYENENQDYSVDGSLRSSNIEILKKTTQMLGMKNKIFPKVLSLIDKYFIFSNIYLDSTHSNLKCQLIDQDNLTIYKSKNLDHKFLKSKLLNNADILYSDLKRKNLILPFRINHMPKLGSDYHFTGTIPITIDSNKLGVNENCELNGVKNLYIVDGSVIPVMKSKFPTALIMANSSRVAELLDD